LLVKVFSGSWKHGSGMVCAEARDARYLGSGLAEMSDDQDIPRVQSVAFDTQLLDPSDRYSAWEENIGVFFDLTMADGSPPPAYIAARIDACNLGATVFGVTKSQSQLRSLRSLR
jgi:hypothetical protein